MLRRKDDETLKREVSLWLKEREIPDERYRNLSNYDKAVLRDQVCTPSQPVSHSQRRELYRRLCSSGSMAGRDSIDPVDSMTDEQLRTFFSSPTSSQGILLDDWGC